MAPAPPTPTCRTNSVSGWVGTNSVGGRAGTNIAYGWVAASSVGGWVGDLGMELAVRGVWQLPSQRTARCHSVSKCHTSLTPQNQQAVAHRGCSANSAANRESASAGRAASGKLLRRRGSGTPAAPVPPPYCSACPLSISRRGSMPCGHWVVRRRGRERITAVGRGGAASCLQGGAGVLVSRLVSAGW